MSAIDDVNQIMELFNLASIPAPILADLRKFYINGHGCRDISPIGIWPLQSSASITDTFLVVVTSQNYSKSVTLNTYDFAGKSHITKFMVTSIPDWINLMQFALKRCKTKGIRHMNILSDSERRSQEILNNRWQWWRDEP